MEDFDAQKSLREVHLSTLSGQSSIYCSSLIPTNGLRRGPERFLVSSLEKNLRIYTAASNSVEYQEKMYAYLPQGCEVISMDLFCDGSTLVTGITWSASNNESPAYFFNSYESNMYYESLTCTSSVELFDWVPFQITHCTFGSSVCFKHWENNQIKKYFFSINWTLTKLSSTLNMCLLFSVSNMTPK